MGGWNTIPIEVDHVLRELEKPKPLTLEQIQQRDSEWYGRSEWEIRTEMERRISKRLNKRKKAA